MHFEPECAGTFRLQGCRAVDLPFGPGRVVDSIDVGIFTRIWRVEYSSDQVHTYLPFPLSSMLLTCRVRVLWVVGGCMQVSQKPTRALNSQFPGTKLPNWVPQLQVSIGILKGDCEYYMALGPESV